MEQKPERAAPLNAPALQGYRQWLAELAEEAQKPGGNLGRCPEEIRLLFDYTTKQGRQIYESYTDAELLAIARQAYQRVKRRPNQKDVYCIYRSYLRKRFGSWPEVLNKLGLPADHSLPQTEIWRHLANAGKEELLLLYRVLAAQEMGNYYPSRRQAEAARKALRPRFTNAAGVRQAITLLEAQERRISPQPQPIPQEYAPLLAVLSKAAHRLGRTPLRAELPEEICFYLWCHYRSWPNVLIQIGLQPLQGRLLQQTQRAYALAQASSQLLDRHTRQRGGPAGLQMVDTLCDLARKLERPLTRADIPEDIFRRLNKLYGSWNIVLIKAGIPLGHPQEANLQPPPSRIPPATAIHTRKKQEKRSEHETGLPIAIPSPTLTGSTP